MSHSLTPTPAKASVSTVAIAGLRRHSDPEPVEAERIPKNSTLCICMTLINEAKEHIHNNEGAVKKQQSEVKLKPCPPPKTP
jgi:hypothetical protein